MDGLRAVAIVLVVAFHVGLAGFSGGFIGVDVFFVISGFLITRGLVAESERQGRPALLRFWARRVRRLVPALGLMLVVVLGLALFVVPFVEWQTVASQARAAALYVSNLTFARQATDYFAPNIDTSLFLHTWSLGVEEQFYLLWPLLVLAVCMVVKDRPGARRAALGAVFGVTFAASLALCIVQTANGSAYAFFGLPARAWEFAAAGLLAIVPVPDSWRGPRLGVVSAGLGIAALALATTVYSQDSTYPGYRALLPVVGALLVIHGGTARRTTTDPAAIAGSTNPVSGTLALAPLQWLGRVSYSWYLWHWPFILLAVQWVGHDSLLVRATAALVALGVGALAHAIVENPARFDPRLIRSRRLTYSMGAAITTVVLVASIGLDGAATAASAAGPSVSLTSVAASAREFDCARQTHSPDGIAYCEDGDLHSRRTLLLVGDSHARHWVPAFALAARQEGVRLIVRWQSICPATPIPVVTLQDVRNKTCDTFHTQTARLIQELRPSAVVTSGSATYASLLVLAPSTRAVMTPAQVWGGAYQRYLASLRSMGIKVGSVIDTPAQCVQSHRLPGRPSCEPVHHAGVAGPGSAGTTGRCAGAGPRQARRGTHARRERRPLRRVELQGCGERHLRLRGRRPPLPGLRAHRGAQGRDVHHRGDALRRATVARAASWPWSSPSRSARRTSPPDPGVPSITPVSDQVLEQVGDLVGSTCRLVDVRLTHAGSVGWSSHSDGQTSAAGPPGSFSGTNRPGGVARRMVGCAGAPPSNRSVPITHVHQLRRR